MRVAYPPPPPDHHFSGFPARFSSQLTQANRFNGKMRLSLSLSLSLSFLSFLTVIFFTGKECGLLLEILPLGALVAGVLEPDIRLLVLVAELFVDDLRWQVNRSDLKELQRRRLTIFTVLSEKIPELARMLKVHLAALHSSEGVSRIGPLVLHSTEVNLLL